LNNKRTLLQKIVQRSRQELRRLRDNRAIKHMAGQVKRHAPPQKEMAPVLFFKASSGITDFTYNSAFNLLAAWGLRLQGVPVIHFTCQAGMCQCVLGTNRQKPYHPPPCSTCIRHSKAQYAGADVDWFSYQPDGNFPSTSLQGFDIHELSRYEYNHAASNLPSPIPLGALVTPGLRWILRRHNLIDDETTRYLYREYILSAWNVARRFAALLDRARPQAVIVFNGQFFPEATVRWVARRRGLRSVTHEVGLQPFSAYFTEGEATAYPIHIPDDFELDAHQNARLDAYLEKRFQGQFSMAGVRFWQDMKGLDEAFLQKAANFEQIVPVFTNVIFDTSQPHANTVFPDMFAWLELVVELARAHPRTLFVIRAHPDETRPGKESQETVQDWVKAHAVTDLPNVLFVAPKEVFSSYELIQRSKFVMIYNSTIGLEASILGVPVLCAGKARFTQYPTVFFPQTTADFRQKAEIFLSAGKIEVPQEFRRNARRFLYYQLFRTSLPFEAFLTTSDQPSLTRFKDFSWEQLLPQSSPAMTAILDGVLKNGDFLLKE
jgi:hypothetical protein